MPPQFCEVRLTKSKPITLLTKTERSTKKFCERHLIDFDKCFGEIIFRFSLILKEKIYDNFEGFKRVYIINNETQEDPRTLIQQRSLLTQEEKKEAKKAPVEKKPEKKPLPVEPDGNEEPIPIQSEPEKKPPALEEEKKEQPSTTKEHSPVKPKPETPSSGPVLKADPVSQQKQLTQDPVPKKLPTLNAKISLLATSKKTAVSSNAKVSPIKASPKKSVGGRPQTAKPAPATASSMMRKVGSKPTLSSLQKSSSKLGLKRGQTSKPSAAVTSSTKTTTTKTSSSKTSSIKTSTLKSSPSKTSLKKAMTVATSKITSKTTSKMASKTTTQTASKMASSTASKTSSKITTILSCKPEPKLSPKKQPAADKRPRPATAKPVKKVFNQIPPPSVQKFDVRTRQLCLVIFLSQKKKLCFMAGPMKEGKFNGRKVALAENLDFEPDNSVEEQFFVMIGPCKPRMKFIEGSAQIKAPYPYHAPIGKKFPRFSDNQDHKHTLGFMGRTEEYILSTERQGRYFGDGFDPFLSLGVYLNNWTNGPLALATDQEDYIYSYKKFFNGTIIVGEERLHLTQVRTLVQANGKKKRVSSRILDIDRDQHSVNRLVCSELFGLVNTNTQGKVSIR